MKQAELAQQLGISKSYLNMILSGQKKCPADLMGRLQSIPGGSQKRELTSLYRAF